MAKDHSDLFLVEHRLPRITEAELDLLMAAFESACMRRTFRGEPVRYLGSTFLPGSDRLLSLFKASTAEIVRSVTDSTQAPLARLEVAFKLQPEHVTMEDE